jgi:hypothetical protein
MRIVHGFLLIAAAATPALAQDGAKEPAKPVVNQPPKDPRPAAGDDAAKLAIERFDRDFASRDETKRFGAISSLGSTANDLVTKKLGTLLNHPNLEVRQAAASTMEDQYQNKPLAGELLRKALVKEEEAEVLINIALALGRVPHPDAIPDMGEVLKKQGNVFVKIEILKSFGKMKDTRALIPILDLWLVNPQGYSWEGGEVKYDSGAAGDGDQKEAERQYKEKYGNQQRKGAPPTMLKTYIQAIAEAVEKITGEKLSGPTALMEWMCKHEAELPYKLPGKVKQTLKDFQDRAAKKAKDGDKGKK